MDSSDSLKIDENLARFLAAYDQSIEGGDGSAATLNVPMPSEPAEPRVPPTPEPNSSPVAAERPVTPLRGKEINEGSRGEVLPDPERSAKNRSPFDAYMRPGTASGPHRIGRFELRRQLGKGGCGIVFLAYDPKLQREVALKIPRPEMVMNTDAKSRLKREALAAAEFDHPNLVPVFETGEIGALCYIATAFCPGQTLAEWLDRQAFPVPVRQAARVVAIVAEAVQHAHDRGVLHRDLKPNNVILQEMKVEENDEPPPGSVQLRGDYFVPRLVDFGLAKLLERGGPSETGTRQILGTPKYMAPEQAQARREDIGPPADVYALGVILYELIVGRAPYDGASDVEVLRQAVEAKPMTPRSIRSDIPRDLEAICLKAMARKTEERFRTAIDLADDLRRFLEGLPTIARPLPWISRAGRWFRRNDQIVAIVVLVIIVVFVTSLGTWNWHVSRAFRQEYNKTRDTESRTQKEREYSGFVREAFLAWRSGNDVAATSALNNARGATDWLMEQPDFTHDYLWRMVKNSQMMIVCPAGSISSLAVSPDGTRIASGHADGTLTVWDRATGKQIGTVKAHASDVTHVAFALGGTRLFTVGKGKNSAQEAFGWVVSPGGELAAETPRAIGESVTCLAVSPDGTVIYAGAGDGRLFKVSLTNPKQNITQVCAKEKAAITAVAVSHSGKTVFTSAKDGFIRCWTPELTAHANRSEIHVSGEVTALAALDDELPAAGCSNGNVVRVARAGENDLFETGVRVRWLSTAPKGLVVQNGPAGRVVIGREMELPTGDSGDIRAGVFSPDGTMLFTGSQDGVIRAWSTSSDFTARGVSLTGHVASIGIAANGMNFLVADEKHVKRVGEKPDGKHAEGVRAFSVVRVLEDGTECGVAFEGRSVVLCDLSSSTKREIFRVNMPDDKRMPVSAALTPAGTHLAVGDDSGRVSVWAVGKPVAQITVDTGTRRPVLRVVLSDDGQLVVAPTPTGVAVWNSSNAEPVLRVVTSEHAVFRMLPGDRLVTAGRDGVVRVWNRAGHEDLTLYGHVGRVTGLGVLPDGRTLVSGGATGEVKFWDLRTGVELFSLRRHSTAVTVIEFASHARVLVTGGDGQFALWDARE